MLELVFANLKVRPFRTFISIVGVAIGVVLIVLFTGLARGMTDDVAKRAANWKAEIVFTRPGGMDATTSNTAVNLQYAKKLLEIEGVEATVPVIRYVAADTKGTWGIKQVDGVDWEPFAKMNGMSLNAGRAPQANDEVIVDERAAQSENLKVGDNYPLFGDKPYKIVGIFSPPSGARTKMSLAALQDALQTDKCTYILVKVQDGYDQEKVAAKINEVLPGNKINLTRELVIDAQERIPGLNTFLRVLVGLAAFVSTIFVLLSMYTTITERRKEIGILKSLGASTGFIIGTIEGEAFLIGILGIVLGSLTAFAASYVIGKQFGLAFEFSLGWILTAVAIAIGGSLVGSLYPAWRASGIDPVEVMINE
ncbi:MAG TPA: ABC transporter permease [Pyrinomonadaceae bacterium]|jgi:putative ABC transport system permease protein|nr:ABC transporter permease [Pyrinomonadaceae bacterium]